MPKPAALRLSGHTASPVIPHFREEIPVNDANKPCDLCQLPVEAPGFVLYTAEGRKQFCCEGCEGIYRMLHEADLVEVPGSSETLA